MGIKYLNYKQIPEIKRKAAAARQAVKLREMSQLGGVLSDNQRKALADKHDRLDRWVRGTLDVSPADVATTEDEVLITFDEVIEIDNGIKIIEE